MIKLILGEAITALKVDQIQRLIYSARTKEFGDWERQIVCHPTASVSVDDTRPFLQFKLAVNIDNHLENLVGWGHPDLINLCKHGPCHLFCDATFRIVPTGFEQCFIIMMFTAASEMYVPLFFVLLQSKTESAYYHAIQQAINLSDWKLEALSVSADFEKAILNAIKSQYPHATIVGCLFHWLQALRRKLKDIGLPKEIVNKIAGKDGVIKILTEIPIEEIVQKGIPYCRSKTDSVGHMSKLNQFWNYFENTWMTSYDPKSWNVHDIVENDTTIINRTNNPLERFNRTLNAQFLNDHPSMLQFISGIREVCNRLVEKIDLILKGHKSKPVHQPVSRTTIPADYDSFVPPSLTRRGRR
jgi:hypothetical protein